MLPSQRLYFNDLQQGTEEWFQVRLGIVTASQFSAVIAKGRAGNPSATRRTYLLKLAGERLTGVPMDSYTNAHLERGHEQEPQARALYQLVTGNKVDPVGFVKLGDDVGASPDGLVGSDGAIEIKARLAHIQLDSLEKDAVPPENLPQIQGQLWVAERDWCDYVSYCPGLPLFVKRVHRDEKLITQIIDAVFPFVDELYDLVDKYSSGAFQI